MPASRATPASAVRLGDVRLGDVLDVANLRARIDSGHIERKAHRDGGLQLLDYTRIAQFENVWDHEVRTCRGLMVTDDGTGLHPDLTVVARGYPKFFTVDAHDVLADAGVLAPLPTDQPFEVTTKADGSLGLGYRAADGRPAIATRGSFHGVQAHWATEHLRADPQLEAAVAAALTGGTPCFEIISPVSRIVVRYDFAGLVLHGLIDRATGTDLPLPPDWPGRVIAAHPPMDLARLAELDRDNEEGFVVRFADASCTRVKVKMASYVRLHRLLTECTTTQLWQHLAVAALRDEGVPEAVTVRRLSVDHRFVASLYRRTGDPLVELLDRVPDEFDEWLRTQTAALRRRYAERDAAYRALFAALPTGVDRKEFAAAVARLPKADRGPMFALTDGASISSIVWRDVRPAQAATFTTDADR